MYPFYKEKKSSKKKKCCIYKKKDGSDKELDLKVHRSFLLLRYFNNQIQETLVPLVSTDLSKEEMRTVYKCVLYSYLSYKDRSIIEFPQDVKIHYEKFDSNVSRIPFFIATDASINAIIVSCRGSSCLDDFITDSLGNGVTYSGGKFHQGVFTTASYVFMTCQTKLIELSEFFNNNLNPSNEDGDNEYSDSGYCPGSDVDEYDEEESEFEEDENDDNDNASHNEHHNNKIESISNDNLHSNQNSSSNITTDTNSANKTDSKEKINSDEEPEQPEQPSNKHQKHTRKSISSLTKSFHLFHKSSSAEKSVSDHMSSTNSNEQLDNDSKTSSNDNMNLEQTIDSEYLQKMTRKPIKIIITGHSLGAAVAAVVAYLFRQKFPEMNVTCICFAPPPTVPFMSVQNVIKMSDIMFPREHTNKLFKKLLQKYLNKNSIEEFDQETVTEEELYPPGQMYLIRFTNDEEDKGVVDRKIKQIKKRRDSLKKMIKVLKDKKKKKKKKDNDNDDDDENNDKGELVKDDQIQLFQVLNPDYFTNLIKNIQENNHAIKNYMRLVIRLMNKNRRRLSLLRETSQ